MPGCFYSTFVLSEWHIYSNLTQYRAAERADHWWQRSAGDHEVTCISVSCACVRISQKLLLGKKSNKVYKQCNIFMACKKWVFSNRFLEHSPHLQLHRQTVLLHQLLAVQLSLHTGTRKGTLTSKKVSQLLLLLGKKTYIRKINNVKYYVLLFYLEQKWRKAFFSCCVKSVDMRAEIVTVYELLFSLQSLSDIIWLLCQNDKEMQPRLIKMGFKKAFLVLPLFPN